MIAKIADKNKIEIYDLTQFDIDAIMHSGQVFRYFSKPDGYRLVSGGNYADITLAADKVTVQCSDTNYFYNYFDLNTDYAKIKHELSNYSSIRKAIEVGGGIRILKADFFETVISFIISANNNIKRFTKTLNGLAEKFGSVLDCGLHAFPTQQQLAAATESQFAALGCGYRSSYLVKAVKQLGELDLAVLAQLPPNEQDKQLQKIVGVGAKVSACIRLFAGSIHDLSVCPIDTWLKKALTLIDEKDRAVLLDHKHAGVAQQYVFYYMQHMRHSLTN